MSIKSILKENGANLSKTSKASKLIASNASEVDICKAIRTTKAYQIPAVAKYVNGILGKKVESTAPENVEAVKEKKINTGHYGEPRRG